MLWMSTLTFSNPTQIGFFSEVFAFLISKPTTTTNGFTSLRKTKEELTSNFQIERKMRRRGFETRDRRKYGSEKVTSVL